MSDQRNAHVWYVTMDCKDPDRLAAFWKVLLEVEIAGTFGQNFVFLRRPSEDAVAMAFQRVPDRRWSAHTVPHRGAASTTCCRRNESVWPRDRRGRVTSRSAS